MYQMTRILGRTQTLAMLIASVCAGPAIAQKGGKGAVAPMNATTQASAEARQPVEPPPAGPLDIAAAAGEEMIDEFAIDDAVCAFTIAPFEMEKLALQLGALAPQKESGFGSTNEPPSDDSADDDLAIASGTVRIRGRVMYVAHDFIRFARHATVSAYDRDSSDDDLLASTSVQADGTFELSFSNTEDPFPFSSRCDPYIVVRPDNDAVMVRNADNGHVVIGARVNFANEIPDGTYNVGTLIINDEGPGNYPDDSWEAAFEICETISNARLYYQARGANISRVRVYWKPGGTVGASYAPDSRLIKLRDGDQYDRSVILKQYGLHVMNSLHGAMPPGWTSSPTTALGCVTVGQAWGDGWAIYAAQSMLNDPLFCDTAGAGQTSGLCFDIEDNTGNCNDAIHGRISAIAVAGALWDIYDALPGDPHRCDSLALGDLPIFDTVRRGDFLQINVLRFRDDFVRLGYGNRAALDSILREHRILPGIQTCGNALMGGDAADDADELDVNADGMIESDDVEMLVEMLTP